MARTMETRWGLSSLMLDNLEDSNEFNLDAADKCQSNVTTMEAMNFHDDISSISVRISKSIVY